MRVLVVCLGNINRSPLVAALLRKQGIDARSAGLLSSGKPASKRMREYAVELGVDLSMHRSQQVSADALADVDAIVYFSDSHRKRLLEKFIPEPCDHSYWFINLGSYLRPPRRSIADPAFSKDEFADIVKQLVEGSQRLAKELKGDYKHSRNLWQR